MRGREIAVAGCGPAGMAAAVMLARDGHRVTLFERFGAPQPVGSGLMIQPTGLAVLQAMGLADELVDAGARIDRLFGRAATSGRTVLDVRYAALPRRAAFGIGVHRAALFRILFSALRGTAAVLETGRTVSASSLQGDGRRMLAFADRGEAGPFDLVVDALGSTTPLAPAGGSPLPYGAFWASLDWPAAAGFDAHALEQRYQRASIMAGVLPIGFAPGRAAPQTAFFWSLRQDKVEAWRKAGLNAWKAEVLRLWPATEPLLAQIDEAEQLTFARYRHRTLAQPVAPALIHIGDAWHSASPQLGQGANMALLDGFALVHALRRSPDIATALDEAARVRRWHVRIYQAMSALFTPVYQSDSAVLPIIRDAMVGPLTKIWPAPAILAAMVSGLIGAPLGRLGLSNSKPAIAQSGPA